MDAALILLYLAAAGVNYGWQPAEDASDGYEYVVQLEPELLDALRRGDSVRVESNVPPDVAPIHKVRIIVGRGDLPRETVGAVNRTAYFAGQAAWTPDRYDPVGPATATSGERYPVPSLPSGTAVAPPPSVLDRAQAAVTETGDTLRDGVEAGIRAANEQLSRSGEDALDATRDARQEFGQRLQGWTSDPGRELQATGNNLRNATERTLGSVGNRLQQVTNPFVTTAAPPTTGPPRRGGVAPPPWPSSASAAAPTPPAGSADASATPFERTASAGAVSTRNSTGWTSIGTTVAAPPLIIPQLATSPRRDDARPSQTSQAGGDGPRFPEAPTARREAIHSPLTDPAQQAAAPAATNDWSSGWGSGPSTPQVTIDRSGNSSPNADAGRNSDLVTVNPVAPPQNEQQSTGRWDDLWDNAGPWGQFGQSAPGVAAEQGGVSNVPANQTPQSQPANNANVADSTLASGPNAGRPPASNQSASTSQSDQPPWLPLLVVSLSLMGSLSANLFLGWSYMDARQKYRSLVRKTADKFRRATSTAA